MRELVGSRRRQEVRNAVRRRAAWVALVIGVAGVVGWVTGGAALLTVGDEVVTMKLNTALVIIALALAFLARRRRLVIGLRIGSGVVSAVTLAQYVGGVDLGIDELVVADPTVTGAPGRMSATTALCVVLLVAAAWIGSRGRGRIAEGFGAAVTLVSWLALLGHLFGAEVLYAIGPFSSVALPTAAALAALGVAQQASVRGSVADWMASTDDLGAHLARRLVPVGLVGLPTVVRSVQEAVVQGWVRQEFALAVTVLVASLVVLVVTVPLARRLSAIDGLRRRALAELGEANDGLEARVEQRTAELVEAEARSLSVANAAPVGIFHTTVGGRATFVNDRWREIYGAGHDDDLHAAWLASIHPDDLERVTGEWQRVLEGAGVGPDAAYDSEYRVRRQVVGVDGAIGDDLRWVHVRSCPVPGIDGVLTGHVGTVEDTTLRRRAEVEQRRFAEQMAHLANHDPLTGLMNRRAFEAALEQQVHRTSRYGAEGALMLLDLDHFKRINDTCGHHVGDQVITHVANALRTRLRTSDLIARLGGDEFAVLLPTGGADDARRVADILVGAVRAATATVGDQRFNLTTSIGLTVFDASGRSADDMMVDVDLAMYDAKEEGRDRWFEFQGETGEGTRTRARLGWIERIEDALEHDRFELYAQPIVDLRTRRTVQLELLVRLVGEDGEVVTPGAFLYVAERYGLITRIDAWVLSRALDVLAQTQSAGVDVPIAVNLSGPSLGDPALAAMIDDAVYAGGFDPARLVVEVTETSAVRNMGAARGVTERLHELGCRVALDDFGAGFASFSYLKHLPFDVIKIDGEFVSDACSNRTDQAIVRNLVSLARELGATTVAEHVQDEATAQFLRTAGVDHAQGFHLGRPVPLAEALAATVGSGPGAFAGTAGALLGTVDLDAGLVRAS